MTEKDYTIGDTSKSKFYAGDKKSEPMNEYIDFQPDTAYTIDPKETWIRLACCDCGLVHDIIIEVLPDKKVCFTLEVNEEATKKAKKELEKREEGDRGKD